MSALLSLGSGWCSHPLHLCNKSSVEIVGLRAIVNVKSKGFLASVYSRLTSVRGPIPKYADVSSCILLSRILSSDVLEKKKDLDQARKGVDLERRPKDLRFRDDVLRG